MDPCPFVRLIVESLSLKLPPSPKNSPPGPGVHPTATPCYCKLHLRHFPAQTALLPLSTAASPSPPDFAASAPGFHLDAAAIRRISGRPAALRVSVYAGRMGRTCGVASGKLIGKIQVAVDVASAQTRPVEFHGGWMKLGKEEEEEPSAKIHLVVRGEPDPRFVFHFGGEPECSPVVFQIQGNIRQPVFSCKFSADRNSRSRSLPSDFTYGSSSSRAWMKTFSGERDRTSRERKGWMIIIHDLSGSPVATASMITPFVPSPGSDRVSRSNPGAWLILRPHGPTFSAWKPWGRLQAWRERGVVDGLGYKFELVGETTVPIVEATLNMKKGGMFRMESTSLIENRGARDHPRSKDKGFVMASTVAGEGKVSKPVVQVGVQHVTCTADAALFVALSAAIDLSMDACRLFSRKLRKELCHEEKDSSP